MADRIFKYPRTPHITGSRLQPGDEDLRVISAEGVLGQRLVVEEKFDGSNAGISFDSNGGLLLQSRGHYLDGGPRERHFALMKSWAATHANQLSAVLGDRYLVYGEWLYAKHTIFYDDLPHYFLEFDVFDKETGEFLSTERRRGLFKGLPIASVPVLMEGEIGSAEELQLLIRRSGFQTGHWRERLQKVCQREAIDFDRALLQTDLSGLMEGLYLKIEDAVRVSERFKFVRTSYTQSIAESDSHWFDRPIIPNQIRRGVDIFAERL